MFCTFIAFATGLGLGLNAALSPGPLMAVILGESLSGGWKRGAHFGLIPLITDPVMMAIALLLVSGFPDWILAFISLSGAALLISIGLQGLHNNAAVALTQDQPSTLRKAVAMNFLNPNLYIYAFTVHSIMLIRYWKAGFFTVVAYLFAFFLAMVLVNSLIAFLGGEILRTHLSIRFLTRINRALSYFLFFVAALFVLRAFIFLF